MITYRVTFIYGKWCFWADIESKPLNPDDRRGFADIAQLAVNKTLDSLPNVERKHIAHDYTIFELQPSNSGNETFKIAYAFENLKNE